MRLSVIIPTFNRRRTLAFCLHRLELQSLPATDFEVLVGDDGSSDGTLEMLRAIATPFKLTISQTGSPPGVNGVTRAMNLGLEKASGEYVFFLDNDMLLKRNALEEVLMTLEEWKARGEDVLVRGWWKDSRIIRRFQMDSYDYRHDVEKNEKLRALLEQKDDLPVEMVHAAQMGLRRDLAQHVGGLPADNTEYGFDKQKEFQHRLKDRLGMRFVFNPEVFGLHGPMRGDATRFDYSNCPRRPRRWQRALSRLPGRSS